MQCKFRDRVQAGGNDLERGQDCLWRLGEVGNDPERVQGSPGGSDGPDCHLQYLAVERPGVHEAQVDLPDGSLRNDACEGERGGCDASEQRQGIHRERDARYKVTTENGGAQASLFRQPARKCRIKVTESDQLREPK